MKVSILHLCLIFLAACGGVKYISNVDLEEIYGPGFFKKELLKLRTHTIREKKPKH